MSDDLSLFDRRMRKSAVISVTGGLLLGFLSVQVQQPDIPIKDFVVLALVYGALAAAALYAVSYRNRKRLLERES